MSGLVDQIPSELATVPISSNSRAPLPPPKPLFQHFQFKTIGKQPALLMRLSSVAASVDDTDMDDIYEDPPLSSNRIIGMENVPSSRPTLLQTLAGDHSCNNDESGVSDPNDHVASIFQDSHDHVFIGPHFPMSLQPISSMEVPNVSKPSVPMLDSEEHLLGSSTTAYHSGACAANLSQDFEGLVRDDRTNATSTSPHFSPSTDDLVIPLSDRDQLSDLMPLAALKTVVALKDKFKALSATARQSQRLAKQALMCAQRSAAASQSCFAAAESLVPCVSEVISVIRRIHGVCGPESEWIAVLQDFEASLHDLKQWSSTGWGDAFYAYRRNALGGNVPSSGTERASSSGILATSVEEEAQEALKAWSQLDQQIQEANSHGMAGFQHEGVTPTSPMPHTQHLRIEDGMSEHQKIGRQSIEATSASQRGGEVAEYSPRVVREPSTPPACATDLPQCQPSRELQDHDQQQPTNICEENHQSCPGEENLSVSTISTGVIGNNTLHSQPESSSSRRTNSIEHVSKPQENITLLDQDARNSRTTSISEDGTEPMLISPISSPSSDVQHPIQPSLASVISDELSRNVAPGNSASDIQIHPPPTTYTISQANVNNSDEGGKVEMRGSLESLIPLIKSEPPEAQLDAEAEENEEVDELLTSNESLADGVEVKPASNIPLKPEPETSVLSLSLKPESAVEIKPACRVSSVDLLTSVPEVIPALKEEELEPDVSLSSVPVKVTTPLTSADNDNVSSNGVPSAQGSGAFVPSNSPAPFSPVASLVPLAAPTSAPAHSPSHPSTIPLAQRVEMPHHIRDHDDSISPDLMSSHGWDADEDLSSYRGRRRSPGKFDSRSRGLSSNQGNHRRSLEIRDQFVDRGTRSLALHSELPSNRLSNSPDRRRPTSSHEHPAPLIGKKRPRDEETQPGPPFSRRDWARTVIPSVSANETFRMPHVSQANIRAHPHSKRMEHFPRYVAEPGHTSNNSLPPPGPSLIHRMEAGVTNPLERRMQPPVRPQQPPQNRHWQNSSYSIDQPSYAQQSSGPNRYNNNQTPELLARMRGSEEFQRSHTKFDSGHSYTNAAPHYVQSYGRGRGFGGQTSPIQQQRFSRKPTLFNRLHKS